MKRWVLIAFPFLILASLIVWRIGEKRAEGIAQENQRAARAKAPAVVSIATVELHDITQSFDATGTVEAPLNVKIAPKVTGRIQFLELREGDPVKKGQVLVRIDPTEVEGEVEQQRAALAEAQYRLVQARLTQNSTNVSVNTQIRQQMAGVSSASADYNQVRENYEAQVAAAEAGVMDAQGKVENANAMIGNAKANLENAKARHDRLQGLFKKGFVAAQDVDDAKTAVSVQEAAVESAAAQRNSALSQKKVAEQQLEIVKKKGPADIAASKARLEQAQASLESANANTAQKSAYQQSIDALRSSVAAAQATLVSAESRRSDTVLVSPLDGFVTGRYADPGAVATPGQPIIAVQFMRQVWVTISVPEEISTKIHMGQQATVRLDALPDRSFTASVVQINPSADSESRQFVARVIMSNKDNLFKPGMYARVSIETERVPKTVAVPREAIEQDRTGTYVIVVTSDNKAERRPVVTGASDTNFVEVEQGIRPGEEVVTMSTYPVRDGQTVRTGGGRKARSK